MLVACQTGPVDSGGVGVQVSEWKTIDVAEVDLNFPLLITAKVTKAEYQNRDNRINHHRLQLDGGQGGVLTQRYPAGQFCDMTHKNRGDIEKFNEAVATYFGEDYISHGGTHEIKHVSGKSVGFATTVNVKSQPKGKCFIAFSGYRLKPRVHIHDRGNIDVLVRLHYCDAGGSIPDFSRALENVDVVTDKAAFADALAAK